MKCTLRKVAEGIVATIDERPKVGQPYWNQINIISVRSPLVESRHYKPCHTIIASTIPYVGKYLKFSKHGNVLAEGVTTVNFNKEYEYTETESQVIIQL